MHGLHLTADLYDCQCDSELMIATDVIARYCDEQVAASGLTRVDARWVKFPDWQGGPGGVTGMVLLAESHLAIHTWPETGNVTLDVYVCNFSSDNSAQAQALMDNMIAAYRPTRTMRHRLVRGDIDGGGSFERTPTPEDSGWLVERLTPSAAFAFRGRVLHDQATPHQSLQIVQTDHFGKVLRLDGRFMTSEKEEFFYHEALVHPAAISHPTPRRCLIIGGGDGGAAEELLKHPSVEQVVVADLDADVIAVAREQFQAVNRGALDDPRVHVQIGDGMAYMDGNPGRFDLILMDLTDPDTPANALYTPQAFARMREALAPGGAVVLHLGSPVFHPEQVRHIVSDLQGSFAHVSPFGLYIPLYGAYWGLAVASDTLQPACLPADEVAQRLGQRRISELQYFNAEVHGALFALPNHYRALVGDGAPHARTARGSTQQECLA